MAGKHVYFRGELPPADAEFDSEQRIDARSDRVVLAPHERGKGWALSHANLEQHLTDRISQEVVRLGGCCALIVDERIVPNYSYGTHEYWLEGRYVYILYRDAAFAGAGTPPEHSPGDHGEARLRDHEP